MLYIVKGPAGSGKTEYLLEHARQRCAEGGKCLLVVSQQVSFEYERMVAETFDAHFLQYITIRSFESLGRDIAKQYGGAAVQRLDDGAKRAAVRRAAESVGNDLIYFRRHRRNEAFYELASREIDELRESGVTPKALSDLAAAAPDASMRAKLSETALIYAAYQSIIGGRFADEQSLTQAAAQSVERDYFSDTAVFFDEFDSFTYPQKLLIRRMLHFGCDVYASLLRSEGELFYVTEKTERALLSAAEKEGAPNETVLLRESRCGKGIAALGRCLAEGEQAASLEGVYYTAAHDRRGEAENAAAMINCLLRQGFEPEQIAVLASDIKKYRLPLRAELERYDIPYFCDYDNGIAQSPGIVVCVSLLENAANTKPDSAKLLQIVKTGMCLLPLGAAEALQNYVFVWSVEGDDWNKPFTRNPSGFRTDFTPAERAALAAAESARALVVAVSNEFAASASGAEGDDIVAALYAALQKLGVPQTLKALCASLPAEKARQTAREYELMCRLLDELHSLLMADNASLSDIAGLIRTQAASVKMFDIPETVSQVSVGDASRARPVRRRAVFVLGAVEGEFPRSGERQGLFTPPERELISENIEALKSGFEYSYYDELLRCYRAVTSPLELLFLSSPAADAGGAAKQCSAFISKYVAGAAAGFPLPDTLPLVLNESSARRRMFTLPPDERADVLQALSVETPRLEADFNVEGRQELRRYFGADIMLSPSRAECFSRCAFKYFMQYVVSARRLNEAKLDYREVGNLLHFLLEQVMRNAGEGFASMSRSELSDKTEAAAKKYMDDLLGDGVRSQRLQYLCERLTGQAIRLMLSIQREQSMTLFKAVDYELPISGRGGVMPRVLSLPGGGTVRIEGKVDRVDVMESQGRSYIRVVDYKTGSKKFSLPEVYYGVSVQMFIYLFSICENGAGKYVNGVPAGVMFMRAEPNMAVSPDKAYRMDGVLIDDPAVIDGVRGEQGVYIPAVLDSKGNVKSSEAVATAEKMGRICRRVDELLINMGSELKNGRFAPKPRMFKDTDPCEKCDYRPVCGRSRGEKELLPDEPCAHFEVEGE